MVNWKEIANVMLIDHNTVDVIQSIIQMSNTFPEVNILIELYATLKSLQIKYLPVITGMCNNKEHQTCDRSSYLSNIGPLSSNWCHWSYLRRRLSLSKAKWNFEHGDKRSEDKSIKHENNMLVGLCNGNHRAVAKPQTKTYWDQTVRKINTIKLLNLRCSPVCSSRDWP
jgi:hypothetical protein